MSFLDVGLRLVVIVLAAFWAAETKFEKNPVVVFWDGVREPAGVFCSSRGVNGALIALESLLGWCTDPERTRRCDMFPAELTTAFGGRFGGM